MMHNSEITALDAVVLAPVRQRGCKVRIPSAVQSEQRRVMTLRSTEWDLIWLGVPRFFRFLSLPLLQFGVSIVQYDFRR
jgi:hypothetical protein